MDYQKVEMKKLKISHICSN